MRVYLVIIDETEEALAAVRFASRRAAGTEGAVHLLAIVPPQPRFPISTISSVMPDWMSTKRERPCPSGAISKRTVLSGASWPGTSMVNSTSRPGST